MIFKREDNLAKSVNSRHIFFQKLWQGSLEADAIFHGIYERDQITTLREKVSVLEPVNNALENVLA